MEPMFIKHPEEAFYHDFAPEGMSLGDEFKMGGKLWKYAPMMEKIYMTMTSKEQTEQWVKTASEVIIPFLVECDAFPEQERQDYFAVFKKHHGPGNVREKHIQRAAELVSQLERDDPVMASILKRSRRVIIMEPLGGFFEYGKVTIEYNEGTYKDAAERAAKAPWMQMPRPHPPGTYEAKKFDLDWRHPWREPHDNSSLEIKKTLHYMLKKLREMHPAEAAIFRVGEYKFIDPAYHEKIKVPRDLDMTSFYLQTPSWGGYGEKTFLKDLHLVFSNARHYYGRHSHNGQAATKLEKSMRKLLLTETGDDGERLLELYDTIVSAAIAADPDSQSWAYVASDVTSDAAESPPTQPSQESSLNTNVADPALPTEHAPSSAGASTISIVSQHVGDGTDEDDEEPISTKTRRKRRSKAKVSGDKRGETAASAITTGVLQPSSNSLPLADNKNGRGDEHIEEPKMSRNKRRKANAARGKRVAPTAISGGAPSKKRKQAEDIDGSSTVPSRASKRTKTQSDSHTAPPRQLTTGKPLPSVPASSQGGGALAARGDLVSHDVQPPAPQHLSSTESAAVQEDERIAEEVVFGILDQVLSPPRTAAQHQALPPPAQSLTSQSTTAESSRPKKRAAEEMDAGDDVEDETGRAQPKRQKTVSANSTQHGTPSSTNLGFATKHSPIKFTTIARRIIAVRSWLFAYRSAQGLGVYMIHCPKRTCRHAFKGHPLREHRARDHFQQCGFEFADEEEMMRECAQQVVDQNNDRRFTIDWMKGVFNGSIVRGNPGNPHLEDENFPPIA
ncbi:hypothetical protein N0V82_010230 [Gnomoniopsis sp. IMI 355080]|nr:hypothetical protein N0V82_010230 [Gnomoniopsis sp. IMI 355080]